MQSYDRALVNSFKNAAFVIGFESSSVSFKKFYIAGERSIYNEVLFDLGIRNIIGDKRMANILMDGELLHKHNPEVIFHIVEDSQDESEIKKMWKKLSSLQAVKAKKVYVLKNSKYFVPGPSTLTLIIKIVNIVKGIDSCCSI